MNIKNISQVLLVSLLGIFSFFYTNKVIDFIRNNDPIMKSIKQEANNYKVDAIDAKVDKKTITPGVRGRKVNYKESYKKMKQYGKYNESLTVFEEVKPTISIDDYYDKYISSGSGIDNTTSLVFVVKQGSDLSNIINILNSKNVRATFFVDGLWLENNQTLAEEVAEEGHEIEVLNYNGRYDELYFSSSLNLVNRITNLKPKYCYASYDNKEVLELCQKLELHTIIPTIKTGNYPYSEVKKKLNKGSIISFDINSSTEIELATVIDYIMQRGYVLDTLDNLLNEATDIK